MRQPADALNGFVDTSCTIRGELEFKNSFRLDGRLEGNVRSQSELLIGESGVVEIPEHRIGARQLHGEVVVRALPGVVFGRVARLAGFGAGEGVAGAGPEQ